MNVNVSLLIRLHHQRGRGKMKTATKLRTASRAKSRQRILEVERDFRIGSLELRKSVLEKGIFVQCKPVAYHQPCTPATVQRRPSMYPSYQKAGTQRNIHFDVHISITLLLLFRLFERRKSLLCLLKAIVDQI
jgi:hypothetical protein